MPSVNIGGFFMEKKVLKIVFFAIFVAIGCLFNILSSNTPLFIISLVTFSAIVTGVMIGPYYGFFAMALADFIIAFLVPQGPWSPILTVSNGLIAFMSGSIVNYCNFENEKYSAVKNNLLYALKIIVSGIFAFVFSSQLLTNMGLVLPPLSYYGGLYVAAFLKRIVGQSVVWVVNIVLSVVFLILAKNTFLKQNRFCESLDYMKGEITAKKRLVNVILNIIIMLIIVFSFIILKFGVNII